MSTANGSMIRFDRKPLFLLLSSFGCSGSQTYNTARNKLQHLQQTSKFQDNILLLENGQLSLSHLK